MRRSLSWQISRWGSLCLLLVALLPASPGLRQEGPPALGQEFEFEDGDVLRWSVALRPGETLSLQVVQQGLDVEISLDGHSIDLPYGDRVTEQVWWSVERPSEVDIGLRSLGGSGTFRVHSKVHATRLHLQRATQAFRRSHLPAPLPASASANAARLRAEELESAIRLWKLTPYRQAHSVAWSELAKMRHRMDDLEGALQAFEEALDLSRQADTPALEAYYRNWIVQTLMDLWLRGRSEPDAGRLDRAKAQATEALRLAQASLDPFAEALAHNHLSTIAWMRNELDASCAGYRAARNIFRQGGFQTSYLRAQLNLGRCQLKLGLTDEALATLVVTRDAAGAAAGTAPPSPSLLDLQADVLRELGWWYYLEDELHKAADTIEESVRRRRSPRHAAPAHGRLGAVYTQLGEFEKARQHYALAHQAFAPETYQYALMQAGSCRLLSLTGHLGRAFDTCHRTRRAVTDFGDESTAVHLSLIEADVLRRLQRIDEAEQLIRQAVERIEKHRFLAGAPEQRRRYFAERLAPHRLLIQLRMELHVQARETSDGGSWSDLALETFEQTRARSLLDLLQVEGVDLSSRVAPDLRRKEQQLLARLKGRSQERVAQAFYSGRRDAGAETEIMQLTSRLEEVREEMAQAVPSYGDMATPRPLGVQGIRHLLDDETLWLGIHLNSPHGFLWWIGTTESGSKALAPASTLERLAASWYDMVADPDQGHDREVEARRAKQLADQLLTPLVPQLRRYRRLVIVADGYLNRIPFGALPNPARSHRPLVVDHEVVVLPSASVLQSLRRLAAKRPYPQGLLAAVHFGPAASPSAPSAPLPSSTPPSSSPLPGAELEVRELLARARALGPTLELKGDGARRHRLLGGALRGYRIVHFATHAQTSRSPRGLLLPGESVEGHPPRLTLQDLYSIRLPAELIVLSACASGIGQEDPGEGLLSMVRGFMYAGSPRVIVSLWGVRDESTRQVMSRFYHHLLDLRRSPSEALRATQSELWARGWPTHHWAAWQFHGDWNAFPLAVENPQASQSPAPATR